MLRTYSDATWEGELILAAAHLTGWWIGYIIGAIVVVAVAVLVLLLIITARRIGNIAADATSSLQQAEARTEILWQNQTVNQAAEDILEAAMKARVALGGGDFDVEALRRGQHAPHEDLKSEKAGRSPIEHSLPTGPQIDRQEGL